MLWSKSVGAVRRDRRRSAARRFGRFAQQAVAFSVETLEQRCLLSTVTWTGAAGDLKWATGGNWSGGTGTGGLPGSGQDVVISSGFATITAATGTLSINTLSSDSPISFTSGSLTIAAGSTLTASFAISAGQISFGASSSTADINQTAGTITGAGPLDIKHLYSWSSGTLSVTGNTTADGGINITGVNQVLSGGKLTNPLGQTATFQSTGSLILENQSTFTNAGTLNAISGEINYLSTPTETFVNSGTMSVNAGASGTFLINGSTSSGVTFNNTGTLNVASGTLLLNSTGTDSGSISVATNAVLSFQALGGYNLSAGIGGAGTVQVPFGALNVNTALTISGPLSISGGQIVLNAATTLGSGPANTITQTGGTISGAGPLDMKGQYAFSAGTLAVTGTTTTDGGMNFSGNSTPILSGANLTNPAGKTVTFGSSGVFGDITLYFENQSTFTNAGTFNAVNGEMTF